MTSVTINVQADDIVDSELVSRAVGAGLEAIGFQDVTVTSHPIENETDAEVLEAIRGLNPTLLQAEVTVEASTFSETETAAADDDVGPGEDEIVAESEDD